MTDLEHFHFLRPGWLLLVPVVLWLWWLVRARQDPLRGWRACMDRDLLTALTVGGNVTPSSHPAGDLARVPQALYQCRGTALLAAWLTK